MSESQNPTGLDVGLTLRNRIAAVLSQHDVNLPDKVADAVIAALDEDYDPYEAKADAERQQWADDEGIPR